MATEKESSWKGQTKYKYSRALRHSVSFSNKSTSAEYENVAWTFLGGNKLLQSFIDDIVKKKQNPQLMDKEASVQYAGDTAWKLKGSFYLSPCS